LSNSKRRIFCVDKFTIKYFSITSIVNEYPVFGF
jgi:hypothetical protein